MNMTIRQMLPDEIVTDRLKLRSFSFCDIPEVFAYWQEPDISFFLVGSSSLPSEAGVR